MSELRPLYRPLRRASLALLCGLMLSSCGGDVAFSYVHGDGFDDGRPPGVSLAVSHETAVPGQSIRLAAAASDANGIKELVFYQSDRTGGFLELRPRVVYQAPFSSSVTGEIETTTPADGRSRVQYFVRATDSSNRSSDSAVQTVVLQP